jgi:hypothetical protein
MGRERHYATRNLAAGQQVPVLSHAVVPNQAEFEWLRPDGTVLRADTGKGRTVWWTFAGSHVNRALAVLFRRGSGLTVQAESLAMRFHAPAGEVLRHFSELSTTNYLLNEEDLDSDAAKLKFSDLLPQRLRNDLITRRTANPEMVSSTLRQKAILIT